MGWWSELREGWRLGGEHIRKGTVTQFSRFDLLVPWWAPYNMEAFMRLAYKQNPVVYASIEYIARSTAIATMYAMRNGRGGDERLSQGHWIQKLLRRPSQLYPTQTRWARQIIRQLLITGECFVYLARQSNGMVGETQILPGNCIEVKPSRAGIKHYEYRPDGATTPIIIQPRDMVFLKLDDPDNPLRGCSPLGVAWREVQADNSMTDYRKAFFDNAAIPGGVLTTNLPANADQLRQWSEDFTDKFSGAKNAGKTPALAGGLSYQQAGAYPKDIDFGNMGAIPESRICMAFGMHPILIAAKVGLDRSTYSNFKEAEGAFWEDTIVPLMGLIEDDLTVGFTTLNDPNFVAFDTSKVPALQPDKNKQEERARHGLVAGAIRVNEYREIVGLNPVTDGDVYYRPNGVTPVPFGELDVKPEPLALEPAPEDGEEDEGGRPPNDEDEQDRPPTPGAANDDRSERSERDRLAADGALLQILQEQHANQHAFEQLERWDRALYVAQVSGAVRSRMGKIVRSCSPRIAPEIMDTWLDEHTLDLGNRMADFAWEVRDPAYITEIAAEYTRKAAQAFVSEAELAIGGDHE